MIDSINKALEVLKKGGIILYPTDTIWGFGCDATNEKAVANIYKIKQRTDTKSMLVLVDNENRLMQYVHEVPDIAWDLIELTNKPLTIIYPNAKNLAKNLLEEDDSIGIRITSDEFCKKLMEKFKKPIVSTSANKSGDIHPVNFSSISETLKEKVDYIVEWRQNDFSQALPSSIIKLKKNNEVKIIRE